ncbi:MAG: hypothetical protein QXP38_06745 [Nitrososphaerota archaeon]
MVEIIKRRIKQIVITTLKDLIADSTLDRAYLKIRGTNTWIVLKHRNDVHVENIEREGIMIVPLNTAFYVLIDPYSIEFIKVFRIGSSEADIIKFEG